MPSSEESAGRKRRGRSLEEAGPSNEGGDEEKAEPQPRKKAARRVSLDVDELEAEIIRELEGNTEAKTNTALEIAEPQREGEDAPRKDVAVEEEGNTSNGTKLKGDISQRLTQAVMSVEGNN